MTLTNVNRVTLRILCIPTPHIYIYAAACFTCCCVSCACPPNCQICPSTMQVLQSLEPLAISSFYIQLCRTSINPVPSEAMCQQASLHPASHTAGLQTAAAVQQKAVKASTNKSRHAVATELISWLQQLNMANRSMQTIMPEDTLVFLVQQWLPNHAGSATNSTELIAAPNSLATAKSHLSKEFELLGRAGD